MNQKFDDAAASAARTEILLQEEKGYIEAEGMERTFKFKQQDIKEAVDITTAKKSFDLNLTDFGPYRLDYTRNGRELLIAGSKGHVATFDWKSGKLGCEVHLNETVRDIKWLHNNQFFAVAQKKYTFIYDHTGAEVHRLKQHVEATRLEFLPYHFLMVSGGNTGYLKYHDVSTGQLVSEIRTKLGPTVSMKQNPYNAVVHCGHSNGTVTLWAPTMSTPLAKLFTCRGVVRDLAIDRTGRYMVAAGSDRTVKVWDIRNFKELQTYVCPTPASSIDISDTGLLSVGWGPHISIWKDAFTTKQHSPYLTHLLPGSTVVDNQFCPFEDALGVGHENGFSSLIVPGSGEPNFDALEINPYETTKQRQTTEVRSLLNKLSPDMITLDPNTIGSLDKTANDERTRYENLQERKEKKMDIRIDVKAKNSSIRKHLRKKNKTIIDQRKKILEARLQKEKDLRRRKAMEKKGIETHDVLDNALDRFKAKEKY